MKKTGTPEEGSREDENLMVLWICVKIKGVIKMSLISKINGHRSAIRKGGQSLFYIHLHQPDHFVDDMRVQILEKIYHN